MEDGSKKGKSINVQSLSARPNLIMFAFLSWYLFVLRHIFIPYVIDPLYNTVGYSLHSVIGNFFFGWLLPWGTPILVYLLYTLFTKQRVLPAFCIGKISAKNLLYVVVITLSIELIIQNSFNLFIPFIFGDVSWQWVQPSILWQSLIMMSVFAVLFEEFVFRGFLFSEYQRQVVAPWKMIFATGLFFGLVHFGIISIVGTTFNGIIWGIMLYYTHSIWAPVLAHAIANGIWGIINPSRFTSSQAALDAFMPTYTVVMAIATVIAIPVLIISVKKFLVYNKNNRIEKQDLPKETKAFTLTYWLLILSMIAAIVLFRV